jgi:hypothetical protein
MLINTETLSESFSPSRTSSPGVVSRLVASLSGRTNASPSASPKALLAGAEETSLVVMVAVARKESKIPRQNSAIPITRSRKARTPPTPSPFLPLGLSSRGKWEVAGRTTGSPGPLWVPVFRRAGFEASTLCLMYLRLHGTTERRWAHHANRLFITTFFANF